MLRTCPSGNPDSSFCAFSFKIPPKEQKAHNFHNNIISDSEKSVKGNLLQHKTGDASASPVFPVKIA
jgi:hypothetical protein